MNIGENLKRDIDKRYLRYINMENLTQRYSSIMFHDITELKRFHERVSFSFVGINIRQV